MGGDHAPKEIIAGAISAAPEIKGTIYLVGEPSQMKPFLPEVLPPNIELVSASEWVEMEEKPTEAYRRKKNSSLMVACELVSEGKAQAMVSAGNTGAATTFSLMTWRRLEGIHRPAIASPMPNQHGGFVLLDAGASPDIDPESTVEFAHMGRAYASQVMGRKNPTVHLLNIGEEEGKGNAFAKQSFALLKQYPWFAGNIEGKDMYLGKCDVVVCDAFVGNVVLKTSEGIAELIVNTIRQEIPTNPVTKSLYWPVRKVTQPLRQQMDYASVGGAPLLGLNGLCIISHGRSNAKAIHNALLKAQVSIQNELIDAIKKAISTP